MATRSGTPHSSEPRLVYSRLNDDELVLIPEDQALELAEVQEAIRRAATWGELKSLLPRRRWLQIVQGYDEADEPLPADAESFDVDKLPGYADGDWPEWPAQEMLRWMPKEIQERFGDVGASMVSGDSLLIDPASEIDVVAALEKAGYICRRDDKLVALASGY